MSTSELTMRYIITASNGRVSALLKTFPFKHSHHHCCDAASVVVVIGDKSSSTALELPA